MSRMIDITVSILLGLGISIVFKLCSDSRSCLVYRAPSDRLIRYANKCYTQTERTESCDSTRPRVEVLE